MVTNCHQIRSRAGSVMQASNLNFRVYRRNIQAGAKRPPRHHSRHQGKSAILSSFLL